MKSWQPRKGDRKNKQNNRKKFANPSRRSSSKTLSRKLPFWLSFFANAVTGVLLGCFNQIGQEYIKTKSTCFVSNYRNRLLHGNYDIHPSRHHGESGISRGSNREPRRHNHSNRINNQPNTNTNRMHIIPQL